MSSLREAAGIALKALETCHGHTEGQFYQILQQRAIDALRVALLEVETPMSFDQANRVKERARTKYRKYAHSLNAKNSFLSFEDLLIKEVEAEHGIE